MEEYELRSVFVMFEHSNSRPKCRRKDSHFLQTAPVFLSSVIITGKFPVFPLRKINMPIFTYLYLRT